MHSIMRSPVSIARAARHAVIVALMLVVSVVAAVASVPVEPVVPARPFTVVDPRPTTVRKTQTPAPMPIRPALARGLGRQMIEAVRSGLGLVHWLVPGPEGSGPIVPGR